MDLGDFNQAIQAVYHILELNHEIDEEVLGMLCQVVTKNLSDSFGKPGKEYQASVEKLMAHIASKTGSPKFWNVYSTYYYDLGDLEKAIEFREKEYRSLQKPGWDQDKLLFEDLATGVLKLCKLYMEQGTEKSFYSAEMKLKSLIKKTQVKF